MNFFAWKNIGEYSVNRYRPCKSDKCVENDIHIVIPKTKYVYQRKEFDKHICLQIIPPRIFGGKKIPVFVFVAAMKQICKILRGVMKKQFVFGDT